MTVFRICDGKVKFLTRGEALAEASLQASQRPHYRWNYYECLWCDYLHIGRGGEAEGHGAQCRAKCARRERQEREQRIIEGTW